MPSLDFTLPHWAYWIGLILFPLVAMALSRRQRPRERRYSPVLGYFILITGGIMGLHRLYLSNLWGLLYIPVFIFILYANSEALTARSGVSDYANAVRMAERTLDREQGRVETARADLPALREALETAQAEADEGSFAIRRAERDVERAETRLEEGEARIALAEADLAEAKPGLETAQADLDRWNGMARIAFFAILAAMAVDAVLLPMLVRRANADLPEHEEMSEAEKALKALESAERKDDADYVSRGWTGALDRCSLYAGEFVSYWAVIAVFVYYFEVLSRYVFGSPTNWAHEAMYLMFGMQYLVSGAYAALTESHVRVDIFYASWSPRRKAIVDLLTSVFYFIFAGTLLVTAWIFAMDALAVPSGNGILSSWARGQISTGEMLASWDLRQWTDANIRWGEISFNEWEVPLWPMKWVMVIGGLLLVLQGISKFAQDLRKVVQGV
ncbi:TRAP transporter small permease subunit [Amaricoccus macauensis]|uniref:TRAP transporter small permease subunit n=1 Tax=Amaricoccus macauensis TaxID=57001 RepID=UPI003C7E65B0